MGNESVVEEAFDSVGTGTTPLALRGDTIRMRFIATRASNKREVVVIAVEDAEFRGYTIGIDDHCLQLLELPSGEISVIALEYIVSITDGLEFSELTAEEKATVDRRTASFGKRAEDWLVRNWPAVYEHRRERPGFSRGNVRAFSEGSLIGNANPEVWNRASSHGDQGRGQRPRDSERYEADHIS